MRTLRRLLAGAFCVVLTTGPGWSSSEAASPNFNCGTLGQSIVKPDGSILVTGEKGPGCYPIRSSTEFLLQLNDDGTVDPGFSDGGVKFLPDEQPVELMEAGSSSAVLATESSLSKVKADGQLDPDFGSDGTVTDIPRSVLGTDSILAAATQSDGKIVVAGVGTQGLVAARFKPDGQLDNQFDGDGISRTSVSVIVNAVSGIPGIGFDDAGRILIGAGNRVIRLTADGALDTSFGPDDSGVSAPAVSGPGFLDVGYGPFVDGDGGFRTYFPVLTYSRALRGYTFDSDGSLVGAPVDMGGLDFLTETADGGLVSQPDLRGNDTPFFGAIKETRKGHPFRDFERPSLPFGPFGAFLRGITYSPGDDSLILTGNTGRSLAVARIDAKTGQADPGFGISGMVVTPGHQCGYGQARPTGRPTPWKRCFLKPPEFSGTRIGISRSKSRRPGLRVTTVLTGAQDRTADQVRRLEVMLPRQLAVRRGKSSSLFTAKTSSKVFGKTVARIEGKKIVAVFHPSYSYDGDPVRFSFVLKRGALKPLPRNVRVSQLRFRFTGTLLTTSDTYWAPSRTTKVFRARLLSG